MWRRSIIGVIWWKKVVMEHCFRQFLKLYKKIGQPLNKASSSRSTSKPFVKLQWFGCIFCEALSCFTPPKPMIRRLTSRREKPYGLKKLTEKTFITTQSTQCLMPMLNYYNLPDCCRMSKIFWCYFFERYHGQNTVKFHLFYRLRQGFSTGGKFTLWG